MPVKSPFRIGFGSTFQEAIDAARARKVTLPDAFYDEIPEQMRQYAFTVSHLAALEQVQAVFDSLNVKIAKGMSFAEWQKEAAGQGWGLSGAKLELLSRNHAQTAYMAGHWEKFERDSETRPFLMYSAINDSRTRPAHRAMNGKIAAVRDPLWLRWSPPCGHNCRCSLISLTAKQAQDRGLGHQSIPDVQPDDGWGHPPADAGDRMRSMLDERVRTMPNAIKTVLDMLLERGYTFPPLSAIQSTVAAETRDQLRAAFGTAYADLSDAETWALREYAADSFRANAYMRGLIERVDDDLKRDIVSMQAAVKRLGDGVDRTTYRGARSNARFDRLADTAFVEGKVIRAQSFISTSSSEIEASEFGDRYFFVIRGRSAANVDGFYTVSMEHEYVFPAGTNFLVVKVEKQGHIWRIELEETTEAADTLFHLQ